MKDYHGLNVGAALGNHPNGTLHVNFVEFDGGEFQLQPKLVDDGVILVDPNRSNAYGVYLRATDPDVLRSVAEVLLVAADELAEAIKKDQTDDEDDENYL